MITREEWHDLEDPDELIRAASSAGVPSSVIARAAIACAAEIVDQLSGDDRLRAEQRLSRASRFASSDEVDGVAVERDFGASLAEAKGVIAWSAVSCAILACCKDPGGSTLAAMDCAVYTVAALMTSNDEDAAGVNDPDKAFGIRRKWNGRVRQIVLDAIPWDAVELALTRKRLN